MNFPTEAFERQFYENRWEDEIIGARIDNQPHVISVYRKNKLNRAQAKVLLPSTMIVWFAKFGTLFMLWTVDFCPD